MLYNLCSSILFQHFAWLENTVLYSLSMKYLFITISTLLSFNVFAVSCIEIPSGDGSFTVEIPYGYYECEVDTGSDSSGVAGLFVGGALAYFLINRSDPDT